MHKRILTAVLTLFLSLQLFAAPLLAQSPPFVFVDDPNGNVDFAPYKIVDAEGNEYYAFQHTDGQNLFFQGPTTSRDDCEFVIYAVSSAVIPDQSTTAQFFEGDCTSQTTGGSQIEDFQALGPSTTVTIEAGATSGDPSGTEEDVPSCESSVGGGLSWIACPVSALLVNVIEGLATWLSTLLQVSPLDTGGATYEIWGNMRNIALGIFVIAVFIVIFGQSLSIDAYTVKRIAPRLGVAAIGIMLSFFVSAIVIDLFNVAGQGMYTLMTSTLEGQGITTTLEGSLAQWATLVGATGAAAVAIYSGGLFYVFSLILIPIVMAFLAGFAVVVVRQVIIIMLVIVAPIAIASTVLPNTNQWFKKWWGLFTSLLMMYPLIMILLAAGRIFAVIITNGEGSITESNFINQVIALAALGFTVGLIPFTLRASSSLLGRIAGAMNNPNRGPIDKWRKAAEGSADYARGKRKEDKLAALQSGKDRKGRAVSGESGAGFNARRRHAWNRITTGTGPLMGGAYADELRAEKQRGAMTKSDRVEQYNAQAEEQAAKLEAFKMKDMSNAEILDRATKPSASTATTTVAYKMLADQRGYAQDELRTLQEHIAAKGTPEALSHGQRLARDNFSSIGEGAPHLAAFNFSTGKPTLSAIADKDRTQIGSVSEKSFEDLVTEGEEPDIKRAVATHLEADSTNQRVNPKGAAIQLGYALTANQKAAAAGQALPFTPTEIAGLEKIANSPAKFVTPNMHGGYGVTPYGPPGGGSPSPGGGPVAGSGGGSPSPTPTPGRPPVVGGGSPSPGPAAGGGGGPAAGGISSGQDAEILQNLREVRREVDSLGNRPESSGTAPRAENLSPGGVVLPDRNDPGARVDSNDLPREPGDRS